MRYSLVAGGLGPVDDWVGRYRRFEAERLPERSTGRPHLRLASATVTVRDQDRSLAFYRDALGFSVVNDRRAAGIRWLSLAPPDGTAVIVLQPASTGQDIPFVGSWTGLMFMTDDIEAKVAELTARGVAFDSPPTLQPWGGTVTTFADIDGNRFALVQLKGQR
jgi:catechol 2,3-dioxygenase-like lactoylglutathione lyase family enzyme